MIQFRYPLGPRWLLHCAVVALLQQAGGLEASAQSVPPFTAPGICPSCEQLFPVPETLRAGVAFWKEVFLRHASDRVILHDRENPGVVWGVIDLPVGDDGVVVETQANVVIDRAVETLRARLHQLETRGFVPTDDEDRILISLSGGDATPLGGAWQRVRAQRGVADHFRDGLAVAKTYLPVIEAVLAEEGVPRQIAALPFVESMYNPRARSSAGAIGIWQLMPATARGLGLKVNARLDERTDVAKATRAAARMLRKSFERLGSWPLAITAYNHGPNGVRRAIEEVGSTDLACLIDNYRRASWGFASKNFYAEFLAALAALASQEFSAWDLLVTSALTEQRQASR